MQKVKVVGAIENADSSAALRNDNKKAKENGRAEALPFDCFCAKRFSSSAKELFGGQFFLFAFHAHLLELALFGFDRGGDFLLDLGCCFFQLW